MEARAGAREGWEEAQQGDSRPGPGLDLHALVCGGDQGVTLPPLLRSTSTVADAYRWLNHTMGNGTVLEEGYYYLNNFDNILNSFGEWELQEGPPASPFVSTGPM